VQEIVELRRQGLTITAIGELTGTDRKTTEMVSARQQAACPYRDAVDCFASKQLDRRCGGRGIRGLQTLTDCE
jgi:hypothetical protein